MCELCGERDYHTLAPIVDRLNYAENPEHSHRSRLAHRIQTKQHRTSLTRYAVRWVGDCCHVRCVNCGWAYIDEANHEGACLPWVSGSEGSVEHMK